MCTSGKLVTTVPIPEMNKDKSAETSNMKRIYNSFVTAPLNSYQANHSLLTCKKPISSASATTFLAQRTSFKRCNIVVPGSEANSYPVWATNCVILKYTEFLAHYTNYS